MASSSTENTNTSIASRAIYNYGAEGTTSRWKGKIRTVFQAKVGEVTEDGNTLAFSTNFCVQCYAPEAESLTKIRLTEFWQEKIRSSGQTVYERFPLKNDCVEEWCGVVKFRRRCASEIMDAELAHAECNEEPDNLYAFDDEAGDLTQALRRSLESPDENDQQTEDEEVQLTEVLRLSELEAQFVSDSKNSQ